MRRTPSSARRRAEMPEEMTDPMWTPSPERIAQANMSAFLRLAGVGDSYEELYQWSVLHPERFWPLMWKYADVVCDERGWHRDPWDEVVVGLGRMAPPDPD